MGKQDESLLMSHRKLVLLVDLDQTLIHTTNENVDPKIKDIYHFQVTKPVFKLLMQYQNSYNYYGGLISVIIQLMQC